MTTTNATSNAHNAADILGSIAATATPEATPKPILNPSRPSAEWSLDELGKFARKTLKKSAEASWELGRALVLAKEKASRKFGKWSQQYVPELSTRTIQRYMAVGRLDYDDVQGKTVSDIYALLWGPQHTGRKLYGTQANKASAGRAIKVMKNLLAKYSRSEFFEGHYEELKVVYDLMGEVLSDIAEGNK